MSGRDSSERVRFLRDVIAGIEQAGDQGAGARTRRVSMGPAGHGGFSFDRALGGLSTGALYEVSPARMGDLASACGFALALARRFAEDAPGAVLWVSDEFSAHEDGSPYAPGIARHGLDPARIIFVRTAGGQDLLWALEEAVRCKGNAAVLADLRGAARLFDLVAARRLTQAARTSGTPVVIIHPPSAFRHAMAQNGARMRFEVASRPSVAPAQTPRPVPGPAHWGVRFAKPGVEAGRLRGLDTDLIRTIIWEHENGFFRDALSLAFPSASGAGTAPRAQSA